MDIGIFQLLPAPETLTDRDVIGQALREADFAEKNGFDSIWIAEHHLSSFGLVGAPSVYAAALAQRTRRIGIGYAVAVVPLHHPVRLAEEIAWLTHLASGRVLVGLGPGFSPFEFGAFDVPLAERHQRFEEGSAILRGLLSAEPFSHSGKHWAIPNVTLRPRPFGGRAPRFLRAVSSLGSLRQAAEAGDAVMFGLKSAAEIAERIDLYRSIRRDAGASPAQIESEIAEFRVLRRVVVAETDREAILPARRALAWENAIARRVHGGDEPNLADGSHVSESLEIPGACLGSAQTVAAGLRELRDLGIRHVIGWLNFGDLPYAAVRCSMEILARDVIPVLGGNEVVLREGAEAI